MLQNLQKNTNGHRKKEISPDGRNQTNTGIVHIAVVFRTTGSTVVHFGSCSHVHTEGFAFGRAFTFQRPRDVIFIDLCDHIFYPFDLEVEQKTPTLNKEHIGSGNNAI